MSYEADVAECRERLRTGSKSFYAASLVLPERVRAPASAFYAFCRVADDAVDEAPPGGMNDAVESLRARLARIYAGTPDDTPIDRALAVAVVRHGVPSAVIEALIDGFLWDAEGHRYETMAELQGYCARVASAVGVVMTLFMGRRHPRVLARACDLGAAMQLTNICRDVGEDARNGRVYLPLAWLRDAGVDVESWERSPRPTDALAAVIERVLVEADGLYARSDAGVAMLPRDCRASIRAARLLYSAIGDEVRRNGYDSVTRRAVVPRRRKAVLLARAMTAMAGPDREPRDDDPPALPAVEFLIDAVARPG